MKRFVGMSDDKRQLKFFVGEGKAVRPAAPQVPEQGPRSAERPASAAPTPSRRFLVGGGKPLPPAMKPVTVQQEYGHPVRKNGCTCARPERTGHVPLCPWWNTAPYECEEATKETVMGLAKMAKLTVGELEHLRIDFRDVKPDCPDVCREERRRCWRCPFWNRHKDDPILATPIQMAYEEVH